jgi:hypothetical protein
VRCDGVEPSNAPWSSRRGAVLPGVASSLPQLVHFATGQLRHERPSANATRVRLRDCDDLRDRSWRDPARRRRQIQSMAKRRSCRDRDLAERRVGLRAARITDRRVRPPYGIHR